MMRLLNIAHRGYSGEYPENTMLAFTKALNEGQADGIETDVHLSSGGEMVLIHDEDLSRTTNGHGMVGSKTIAELRALDAGLGEKIPLLSELLELVKTSSQTSQSQSRSIVVNIELKNTPVEYPGLESKVIGLVREFGLTEQVRLSSFNHSSMALVKRLAPEFYTGLLYSNPRKKAWELATAAQANALNPYYMLLYFQRSLIKNIEKRGLDLNVWTVNEEKDIKRLMKLMKNVAGGSFITNYPRLVRESLDGVSE